MRSFYARFRQGILGLVLGLTIAAIVSGVIFERHFAADYQRKGDAIADLQKQMATVIGYLNAHPIR